MSQVDGHGHIYAMNPIIRCIHADPPLKVGTAKVWYATAAKDRDRRGNVMRVDGGKGPREGHHWDPRSGKSPYIRSVSRQRTGTPSRAKRFIVFGSKSRFQTTRSTKPRFLPCSWLTRDLLSTILHGACMPPPYHPANQSEAACCSWTGPANQLISTTCSIISEMASTGPEAELGDFKRKIARRLFGSVSGSRLPTCTRNTYCAKPRF